MAHDPTFTGDLIVNLKDAPSAELGTGTSIQLLRCNEMTGEWVLWVTMKPGATFAPHWHLGDGQYFVTKGELVYDVGSAPAGTYGYEPIGSRHNEAHTKVDTEFLFMGRGAVAFTDDNGEIRFILNHEYLRDVHSGKLKSNIAKEGMDQAA